MSLWNSDAPLPYSVQYNSDPRCRHQIYNRRAQSNGDLKKYDYCRSQTHLKPHPYIAAYSQKYKSEMNIDSCRFQGIGTKSLPNSRNRKRKYMDMFGSDEQGRYEYNQSLLVIGPLKKKKITERDMMETVYELNKPKAPKAWKQMIQTYYSNNGHCDVQQFTKLDDIENKDKVFEKRKKKRAIRLHPSYAGISKTSLCVNAEKAKEIANQSYVNRINTKLLQSNEIAKGNDAMDCD